MKKNLRLLDNLLSLFYPRSCIACHAVLQEDEQHLCLNCYLHLPETNYHLLDKSPLNEIFFGRVKVENTFSFLFYRKGNHTQAILHHLKYKNCKEIGAELGEYYGKKLAATGKLKDVDYILPIPLHPKKQKLRGYNQSEWIAMGLGRATGIPVNTQLLIRSRFTETQTKKSRFNRWENVKDVFEVSDKEELTNKHVIICDDVLTTGATTEAAIRKILEVENTKVTVVTIATAKG